MSKKKKTSYTFVTNATISLEKATEAVISVDPGTRLCGVAIWKYHRLEWAGLVPTAELNTLPRHDVVVVEKPQKDRRTFRVRMKDFINLSVAAGEAAQALVAPNGHVVYYLPNEWKGSLPKEVTTERSLKALTEVEIKRIELPKNKKGRSDVMDSVSLGLAHMRKIGVRVGKCLTVKGMSHG